MPPPHHQNPTHFLALPLITNISLPRLQSSLARFARDKAISRGQDGGARGTRIGRSAATGSTSPASASASADYDDVYADGESQILVLDAADAEAYIPAKAIRPVGTLHLTLGIMDLRQQGRLESVGAFLADAVGGTAKGDGDGEVVDDDGKRSPIKVQLRGLHAMQQPQRTRVLYAEPVDASGRLMPFCRRLRQRFVDAGYIIPEERDLKLHATIVNTIYAGKTVRGGKSRKIEFDARDVIRRWKDEVWAEVDIDRVAVYEMGAKQDVDGKVRYTEVAGVML